MTWVQFSSVAQSCPTLCDSMDCSTPGCPVHYQLPEFTQAHIHWVGDAIQPSHRLSSCLQSFPASGSFQMSKFFASGGQSIGASASASVFVWLFRTDFLYDWLVWSPCNPRDSQESSPIPHFKSISSSAFSLLHGPSLKSICDCWKNHSFDYMDLCWQSEVSAF